MTKLAKREAKRKRRRRSLLEEYLVDFLSPVNIRRCVTSQELMDGQYPVSWTNNFEPFLDLGLRLWGTKSWISIDKSDKIAIRARRIIGSKQGLLQPFDQIQESIIPRIDPKNNEKITILCAPNDTLAESVL